MFSLCLQITKVIANSEISKNGREILEVLKLRNIIKGRDNAALTLASDTILNKAISNSARQAKCDQLKLIDL